MPVEKGKRYGEYTRADFVEDAKSRLDVEFSATKKPLGGADEFLFFAEKCIRRAEQFAITFCAPPLLGDVLSMFMFVSAEEEFERAIRLWNRKLTFDWPRQPAMTFWWLARTSAAELAISALQYFVTGGNIAALQTFGEAGLPSGRYDETDWKPWTERFRTAAQYPNQLGRSPLLLRRDCEALRLRLHDEFRQFNLILKPSVAPQREPQFQPGITDLTPKYRAAFSYIKDLPGPLKGAVLAERLGIEENTFRSHYVPRLTPHGLKNGDDGYYIEPIEST